MTAKYRQQEWSDIFRQADQDLVDTQISHEAPSIESAAFAQAIDHTLLKPGATEEQIDSLCQEAIHHNFKVILP